MKINDSFYRKMTSIQPLIPINKQGWNLEEIAEELLKPAPAPAGNAGSGNVQVSDNPDFWKVEGVEYRNGIYTVELAKALLDNGNTKTQDQWIEYSKQVKARNGFYTGDFQLYHSLFTALYKNRDKDSARQEVEEARKFLRETFRKKYPLTLTRIAYQPRGMDKIIHSKGMPDEFSLDVNFVDSDEWVKDAKNPAVYKALLGSDNIHEINNVYNWINGTDAYLYRLNSKPSSIDERVARFIADSVRADLDCDWFPRYSDSTLGVRVARSATM